MEINVVINFCMVYFSQVINYDKNLTQVNHFRKFIDNFISRRISTLKQIFLDEKRRSCYNKAIICYSL